MQLKADLRLPGSGGQSRGLGAEDSTSLSSHIHTVEQQGLGKHFAVTTVDNPNALSLLLPRTRRECGCCETFEMVVCTGKCSPRQGLSHCRPRPSARR